uniref:Uncharacterized protein n=1 Tax=Anguilla anguilla TaxID=7936 RepID=A0A0E9TN25_ANGAN
MCNLCVTILCCFFGMYIYNGITQTATRSSCFTVELPSEPPSACQTRRGPSRLYKP